MTTLIIDGIKKVLQDQTKEDNPVFYDYDEGGTQQITETTELGESLRELNNDRISPNSRMSGIDMRSRLHYVEISNILAVDTLVAFKFLPISCLSFTRQKKRLAVSLDGKGRDDIVDVVAGKREQEAKQGSSLFDKFKGIMPGGNKQNGQEE